MDWLFRSGNQICSLRVAGILVQNNYLLVQRDKNTLEHAIPGGHVKTGEVMTDALIREFCEEMNLNVDIKHLLWTEECFWEWNGLLDHNICFYFLIGLCNECALEIKTDFLPQKDNPNVEYGWLPIDNLANVTLYPDFIKEEICNLDWKAKHFVTKA